ncbi:hypothetical protein [Pseudoalteromonas lipolytica]|jgi:hypothetical protein|uniref:hypothetical protein n=1 Tax=Pseudoalteromonas lipolytica TaxID=570156 RepID=UPI003A96B4C2
MLVYALGLLLVLSVSVTCIRIAATKHGFSKVTKVLMLTVNSGLWVLIFWLEFESINIWVRGLISILCFECALWISSKAETRYLQVG